MHTVRFACDCLIKTQDMAISTHFTSYLIFERSHIGPRACSFCFCFFMSVFVTTEIKQFFRTRCSPARIQQRCLVHIKHFIEFLQKAKAQVIFLVISSLLLALWSRAVHSYHGLITWTHCALCLIFLSNILLNVSRLQNEDFRKSFSCDFIVLYVLFCFHIVISQMTHGHGTLSL